MLSMWSVSALEVLLCSKYENILAFSVTEKLQPLRKIADLFDYNQWWLIGRNKEWFHTSHTEGILSNTPQNILIKVLHLCNVLGLQDLGYPLGNSNPLCRKMTILWNCTIWLHVFLMTDFKFFKTNSQQE